LNVSDSSVDSAARLWRKAVTVTVPAMIDEIQNSSSAGLNRGRICPLCSIARASLGHGFKPFSVIEVRPSGASRWADDRGLRTSVVNPLLTIPGSGLAPTARCFPVEARCDCRATKKGHSLGESYFGDGDWNAVSLFALYYIGGLDAQPT
jgi:hypothetical protein